MRSHLLSLVAATAAVFAFAAPSWADNPGHHPAYLHALSDLRDARAHLEHLTGSDKVNDSEMHAIEQIDKAIGEIKHAAIDDGKNINDHVPVDSHMKAGDRYHRALDLLNKAKNDVSGEEDQADTQGLQMRVLHHIEEAKHAVHHAIETILNGQ